MIRNARPDEYAVVGELRVAAYRVLGLLPEGSGYAQTLRSFGFGGDCAVLVAAGGAGNGILGTITLEPFDPASELARDETEADIRAFAVAPQAQGQGVGQKLLLAVIERAEERGVRRVRLCTQSAMRAARHLYETTGFSRTPDLDFEPVPGLTLQAYELALPLAKEPGGQPVSLSLALRAVRSSASVLSCHTPDARGVCGCRLRLVRCRALRVPRRCAGTSGRPCLPRRAGSRKRRRRTGHSRRLDRQQ